MTDEYLDELGFSHEVDLLYQWVDQQVQAAGPICELSGRCCHFQEYGHRLYLTQIEARKLFKCPVPEQKTDSNPECPYQVGKACMARDERPLGCRIYFCDPNYQDRAGEITEEAISRLKSIHNKYHKEWIYKDLELWNNKFA